MSGERHAWVVLKFGGTSVATRARWETIAEVVRARWQEGLRPLVVCSALSGVSDALEALLDAALRGDHAPALADLRARHDALAAALDLDAAPLLEEPFETLASLVDGAAEARASDPRLRAQVMAMGELLATRLGAAYLAAQGLPTRWYDARTMLRAGDEPDVNAQRRYLAATCTYAPDAALQARLAEAGDAVCLTQGFIAANSASETVLLGRGGSDTSAAYLAAKLEARRLEIWTDVPGMFTANPRQIPSARLLRQLGYNEAQELATMGGKVLHPRCIEPVRRAAIPLHIRCTEAPALDGTVISNEAPGGGPQVKAISSKAGVTLIAMDTLGMWQQVGFLADVFAIFKRNGLSVDLVATSETNVTVSLDPQANALDPATVEALLRDLNTYCYARAIGPCAVVSLVGRNIRSMLHRLGPAFEVFDERHIYLVSQAASDLNISFVVDEEQAARLVRELHAQLFGKREADALLGPSWRELFDEKPNGQPEAPAWWRRRRDELLALAAERAPVYVYDEATLRETASRVRRLAAIDHAFYAIKANPHPGVLRVFYEAGLGFECVSPGELEHVRTLFPGLPADRLLFTPNFAPPDEYAFGFTHAGYVTLDNLHPLETQPGRFAGHDLIVRVDPGRGHGHHKYVRTAGAQSKFGIEPQELPRLRALADATGARIVGLHAHLGSGILTPETWADTAHFLASLAEDFPDVRLLNLGGGLGVPDRSGVDPLDLDELAAHLAAFKAAHPRFALWLEPGRYLVARAGVLLARVTQTKRKGDVYYIGLETGMNSLIRPALYGAYHEIVNLTRLGAPATVTAEVVGPICETGDVLGYSRRLPETEAGDVVLIATAGAYGRAMSSRYNLREPAEEVLLPAAAG